jgi:beta-lactamase superfamily II metal-dependent hydrolase
MAKRKYGGLVSLILIICILFSMGGCTVIGQFIPELCNHAWNDGEVTVEATCVEKGEKIITCDICGTKVITETEAKGHSFLATWTNNNEGHWHDCEACGEKSEVVAHTFADSEIACSICAYEKVQAKGAISFHFMMLGNDNAGDSIYIKAGDNDILIDAGSRENSIDDIKNYVDTYCTDNKLEYVIVTHADQDHIAGFSKSNGSIFDLYECQTIIDFPLTDKTTDVYNRYVTERNAEVQNGAKHFTALECYNNSKDGAKRIYNLTEDGNVKMEILYNYFYENKSKDENNYSVCVMFYHGDRQFLFTGDLEKEGEEYLANKYDFSQVELYKAGHHGSRTSSNTCLLKEIKPKMCVVCCCAGSVEYTDNLDRTFPTQEMIDRIAPYTDKIYVPITIDIVQVEGAATPNDVTDDDYDNQGEYKLLNGNIVIVSDAEKGVYADCSNNNTLLKDTEWFKQYRDMPDAWKVA